MKLDYYLNSSHIFKLEGNRNMCFNIMTDALKDFQNESILWYEFSRFYFEDFVKTESEQDLRDATSCMKMALQIEPENAVYKRGIERYLFSATHIFNITDSVQATDKDKIYKLAEDYSSEFLIESFNSLKKYENKLAIVFQLGETRNRKYLDFIEYCILNSKEKAIVQSARKRLTYYLNNKKDLEILLDYYDMRRKEIN